MNSAVPGQSGTALLLEERLKKKEERRLTVFLLNMHDVVYS